MSAIIAQTTWPTVVKISPAVRHLIARNYEIADIADPTAGNYLADEILTESGSISAPGGKVFRGHAEIRTCRERAWDGISARHHLVHRVFVADPEALDLLIVGSVSVTLKSGKVLDGEFTSRLVVDPDSMASGQPRLQSVTIWADTLPLVLALKEMNSSSRI
ncbi:hypothetical protein BJX64DRAFT_286325 [Aspergillus heterothallicus]